MDKIAYAILGFLCKNEVNNKVKALTLADIHGKLTSLKSPTIYKRLSSMIKEGYIAEGIKEGRANTYFITEDGIKKLENI